MAKSRTRRQLDAWWQRHVCGDEPTWHQKWADRVVADALEAKEQAWNKAAYQDGAISAANLPWNCDKQGHLVYLNALEPPPPTWPKP